MSPGTVVLSIASAVVLGSIVAGVILVGGPAERRIERLDDERVSDLQGIMRAVDRFWKDHEQLPETLEDLAHDPRQQVNTIDPASAEPYEYLLLDESTYRLCAAFDGDSRAPNGAPAGFWSHASGTQCFELEVRPAADSD